jgi:hypothetical protein
MTLCVTCQQKICQKFNGEAKKLVGAVIYLAGDSPACTISPDLIVDDGYSLV